LPNHAGRPLYSENGRVECTLCSSHAIFLRIYPLASGAGNGLEVEGNRLPPRCQQP
jgi:hypothetical protein